jgi:ABC-2 type transport system permease protein
VSTSAPPATHLLGAGPAVRVVAVRELRDLWLAGKGVPLMLSFSVVLSVTTYLVASNQALNFLEQRESVTLTLQVAVAVGALLVLLGAADAISGERERGSLETLLLSPVPRRSLVLGKAAPALSLWVAAYLVTVPYVVHLSRGVGVAAPALGYGLLVGTLLAAFLAGLGLLISCLTRSNRLSLALSLFVLLALFAPTQMPSSAQGGRFGDLLQRVDPFTAGLHVLGQVVTDARGFSDVGSWLVGPVIAAALAWAGALVVAGRLSLDAGDRS